MPNPFTSLLTGGLGSVLDGVKGIISEFVVDPQKKLDATTKLAELEMDFRSQQLKAESDFANEQAQVIIAEAKSESWIARNWRPITMLTFVFIIVWNYIVIGTIGSYTPSIHTILIPDNMWSLLDIGIGGYIGARTVEKVSDTVATMSVEKSKHKLLASNSDNQ